MSNFRSKAFNPASKRVEDAEFCDDYYGRHRYGIRFDDGCVHPEAQCGIDAAATAIDSLLKERDALKTELEIWQARATRLQQERDEAIAALNAILSANDDFRAGLPQDWEGDQMQDACDAARDLVRRLAGHEKEKKE